MKFVHKEHKRALFRKDPHCHYCGIKVVLPQYKQSRLNDNNATLDHIVCKLYPRAYKDNAKNVVLSCWRCNKEKSQVEWSMTPHRPEGHTLEVSKNMLSILSGKI